MSSPSCEFIDLRLLPLCAFKCVVLWDDVFDLCLLFLHQMNV